MAATLCMWYICVCIGIQNSWSGYFLDFCLLFAKAQVSDLAIDICEFKRIKNCNYKNEKSWSSVYNTFLLFKITIILIFLDPLYMNLFTEL